MKIEDVAVVDFYIDPTPQKQPIKALVHLKLKEVAQDQIAWVDLTPQEIKVVKHLTRLVEQRLLLNPPDFPTLQEQLAMLRDISSQYAAAS